MSKSFHVDSIQKWESFEFDGSTYCLAHLSAHEIKPKNETMSEKFIVTYGLHCFAKADTGHNISLEYADGRESLPICLERYHASKKIRPLIGQIASQAVHQTTHAKYFSVYANIVNPITEEKEPYKICMAIFKENRKLRMHITTAFFVREGEGSPETPISSQRKCIFDIAKATIKAPRNTTWPKEPNNRMK
ncbi:hypothetical protein [Vibrio cyclitrophicus]|uniref:hypothetical protein n=1 Tax=Vibrio cyclitrophicus TaxID=47951 RepID=UPI0032E4077A